MKVNKKIILSYLIANLSICFYTMTNLTSCVSGLIENNDKLTCDVNQEDKVNKITIINAPIKERISNIIIPFHKKDTTLSEDDLKKIVFSVDIVDANKYIEIVQCYSFNNNDSLTIEIDYWIRLSILNQKNDQEISFNIIAIDYDNNWKQIFSGFKILAQLN